MPFCFKVGSLVSSCWENSMDSTSWACQYFFLCLFRFRLLLLLAFLFMFFFPSIFFLLFSSFYNRLKSTKLFIFKIFSCLIYNHIDQNFHSHFFIFLAHQVQFSIFIGLDVVYSGDCLFFLLLTNKFSDSKRFQLFDDYFLWYRLESNSDSHFPSGYLVLGLKKFDTL